MDQQRLPAENKHRDPLTHEAHKRLVLKWSMQNPGITSDELAEMLFDKTGWRVTGRQIRYDLEDVRKEVAVSEMDELKQLLAVELQRLDVLEREAWDAWRRSQEVTEEAVKEMATAIAQLAARNDNEVNFFANDDHMFIAEIERKTKRSSGDFQYLRVILDIQRQRHKLLGLGATKVDIQKRGIEIKGYVSWSPKNWTPDEDILEGTAIKEVIEDEIAAEFEE